MPIAASTVTYESDNIYVGIIYTTKKKYEQAPDSRMIQNEI